MSYEVYLTEAFQKCMKILKKKYRLIKDDDLVKSHFNAWIPAGMTDSISD